MPTYLKTVNFGTGKSSLSTVGFSIYNTEGVLSGSRSTSGVHEVGADTGIYSAPVSFTNDFKGSVLWDTGQGSSTAYAAEGYNPTNEDLDFLRDMTAGKWTIDASNKQMIFYGENNTTEIARFDLTDRNGNPSITEIFTRTRV